MPSGQSPQKLLEHLHAPGERDELLTVHAIAGSGAHEMQFLSSKMQDVLVKSQLVLQVHLRLTTLDLIEGWLCDVQIAALDDWPHVTEEKSQEQGTDMRPIHSRVSHDDDAVIADLLNVKIIATNPGPKSRDEHLDLLTAEHL